MLSDQLRGHLSIAAAYTIFGLNLVLCKDIANSAAVAPHVLFTFRALGASALFWLVSLFQPQEKIQKGDMWRIALASFLGFFLTQMTFLIGITMATAIDSAILGTLGPVFTMIVAYFFVGEPITGKKAGGVTLSLMGVLFLIFNSVQRGGGASATTPLGLVMLLLNSLTFAMYLGIFRPLVSKYSVVTFMKWVFLFSLLMSLPLSAKEIFTMDYAAIPVTVRWEIGYLIFFATFIAYYLIPYGQKLIRPTLVSMYNYLSPIIATVVSIWTGMDHLTWQKVLAAMAIVGGVILVSKSRAATNPIKTYETN
ncbi:MAG: DMT family transporter [Bacteroidales bacterium]|nr:DMT family transporter [Bacteroidales bacterium]